MTLLTLSLKYELTRRRLESMAMRYGLSDPRVLAQSKRVDKLVTELQRRRLAEIKEAV